MKIILFIAGIVIGYMAGLRKNCNKDEIELVLGLLQEILEIEGRRNVC